MDIQRTVNQRLTVTNFINLCDLTLARVFNCNCKAPRKGEKYHRENCASLKNRPPQGTKG